VRGNEDGGLLSRAVDINNGGQLGFNLVGQLTLVSATGDLLYEGSHLMPRGGVDQQSANGWLAQHGEKPLDIQAPTRSRFQLTAPHGNNTAGYSSRSGRSAALYYHSHDLRYLGSFRSQGETNPEGERLFQGALVKAGIMTELWPDIHNYSNLGITIRATCFYQHPTTYRG